MDKIKLLGLLMGFVTFSEPLISPMEVEDNALGIQNGILAEVYRSLETSEKPDEKHEKSTKELAELEAKAKEHMSEDASGKEMNNYSLNGDSLMPPSRLLERPIEETLTDQAFIELAHSHPDYKNVGMLEAKLTIPLCSATKRVFSASAVYMGGKTVVTNAHCVELWVQGLLSKLFLDLYFKVEREGGGWDEYLIKDILIHPKGSDIALLKLDMEILGLRGLPPSYDALPLKRCYKITKLRKLWHGILARLEQETNLEEKRKLIHQLRTIKREAASVSDVITAYYKTFQDKDYICIGYGTNSLDGWLSYNDQQKRAVMGKIRRFYSGKEDTEHNKHIVSWPHWGIISTPVQSSQLREPFAFEGGFRHGMSGGAMLIGNHFVGINTRWSKMLVDQSKLQDLTEDICRFVAAYCKYLAAAGIPMPLLSGNSHKHKSSIFLMLAPFKDWIEEHRQEWDQN